MYVLIVCLIELNYPTKLAEDYTAILGTSASTYLLVYTVMFSCIINFLSV